MQQIDKLLENIHFEDHCTALFHFYFGVGRWEFFHRFHILVQLKIQATLQLTTLARQLLRIQRKLLVARGRSTYTSKVCQPTRTTQFSSTHTDASNASRFLSRSNLAHFYAHRKGACQFTNQIAKIHTVV